MKSKWKIKKKPQQQQQSIRCSRIHLLITLTNSWMYVCCLVLAMYLVLNIVSIWSGFGIYQNLSWLWLCCMCGSISWMHRSTKYPFIPHTKYKNGFPLRNIQRRVQLSCYIISFCVLWYPLQSCNASWLSFNWFI